MQCGWQPILGCLPREAVAAGRPNGFAELAHEHATSDLAEQVALRREVPLDLVGVLASS